MMFRKNFIVKNAHFKVPINHAFQAKVLISLLFLSFFGQISAHHTHNSDSLIHLLQNLPDDTVRVNVLVKLSETLSFTNTGQALHFAKEALPLSQKLNFSKGEAFALLCSALFR